MHCSLCKFWSSVELTGNQTERQGINYPNLFWSSVELTGNQTVVEPGAEIALFWSSVELTGNQTVARHGDQGQLFWSSVELTGNQTQYMATNAQFAFWSSVELAGNQTCSAAYPLASLATSKRDSLLAYFADCFPVLVLNMLLSKALWNSRETLPTIFGLASN